MKKLHVNVNGAWLPVFCYCGGSVITCKDARKALPQWAAHGKSDLEYFSNNFANQEFRLLRPIPADRSAAT